MGGYRVPCASSATVLLAAMVLVIVSVCPSPLSVVVMAMPTREPNACESPDATLATFDVVNVDGTHVQVEIQPTDDSNSVINEPLLLSLHERGPFARAGSYRPPVNVHGKDMTHLISDARWLAGTAGGVDGSIVRVSVHRFGLQGFARLSSGHTLVFEPPTHPDYAPSPPPSPSPSSSSSPSSPRFVCVSDTITDTSGRLTKGDTDTAPPHARPFQAELQHRRQQQHQQRQQESDMRAGGDGGTRAGDRVRREGPINSNYYVCTLYVDIDSYFYDQWKGPCSSGGAESDDTCRSELHTRALVRAIDIIHQASAVFEDNFNHSVINYQMVGVSLHTNDTFGSLSNEQSSASEALRNYGLYLAQDTHSGGVTEHVRGQTAPTSQDVCMNYLLTHIDLIGTTVGFASRAAVGFEGGICSSYIFEDDNNDGYAVNVGFTSTNSNGSPTSTFSSVLTTAHELGHASGARHDCCTSDPCGDLPNCNTDDPGSHECWPSAEDGGPYLMFPSVSSAANAGAANSNAATFSPCSRADIVNLVANEGNCLIREDPCAFGGDCCDDGGDVLPAGTFCRPADPLNTCVKDAVCNGVDGYCPPFDPKPDGMPCDLDANPDTLATTGTCHEGQCSNIYTAVCSQINLQGCTLPGNECIAACRTPGGSCYAYASACGLSTYWRDTETCIMASEDAPCAVDGMEGMCSLDGTCAICDSGTCNYTTPVNTRTCEFSYEDTFGPCEGTCGAGVQRRVAICYCDGDVTPGSACGIKPDDITQACELPTCPPETTAQIDDMCGVVGVTYDEDPSLAGKYTYRGMSNQQPYFIKELDFNVERVLFFSSAYGVWIIGVALQSQYAYAYTDDINNGPWLVYTGTAFEETPSFSSVCVLSLSALTTVTDTTSSTSTWTSTSSSTTSSSSTFSSTTAASPPLSSTTTTTSLASMESPTTTTTATGGVGSTTPTTATTTATTTSETPETRFETTVPQSTTTTVITTVPVTSPVVDTTTTTTAATTAPITSPAVDTTTITTTPSPPSSSSSSTSSSSSSTSSPLPGTTTLFTTAPTTTTIFGPSSQSPTFATTSTTTTEPTTTTTATPTATSSTTTTTTTTTPAVVSIEGFATAFVGVHSSNSGQALRFSTAFDSAAIISTTSNSSPSECGDACVANAECLGVFWWEVTSAETRCVLLRDLGTAQGIATGTVSVSLVLLSRTTTTTTTTTMTTTATPPVLDGFNLVFLGHVASNTNGPFVRFSTAFDSSAQLSSTSDVTLQECGMMCIDAPECAGIFVWTPLHGTQRCVLLRDVGSSGGTETGSESYSFQRIVPTTTGAGMSAATTTTTPPTTSSLPFLRELDGYEVTFTGAIDSNTGDARRFSTAFDASFVLNTIDNQDTSVCAAACDSMAACLGIFLWIQASGTTRCVLLSGLGAESGATTASVSLSLTKVGVAPPTPDGYELDFVGNIPGNDGEALRFSSAFDATARIQMLQGVTTDDCSTACDSDDACLGFFFWIVRGDDTRCYLLNTLGSSAATSSQSYSFRRVNPPNAFEAPAGYVVSYEGNTATNADGQALRFHTAFDESARLATFTYTTRDNAAACAMECNNITACTGIFYWIKSADSITCHLLAELGDGPSATASNSYSLAKLSALQVTVPAGYNLTFEGLTFTNTDSPRRFSTAFDDVSRLGTISDIGIDTCATLCTSSEECAGFFHWTKGSGELECRLLNDLGREEGSATTSNSYSFTKL